jgi:organic radical activating enzyme
LDEALIDRLHEQGFIVAIETNGTRIAPNTIDWVCVSPKAGAELVQRSGDELKLVYPQTGAPPEEFEQLDFDNFFLQPMDGATTEENTRLAVEYCMTHPRWRLSVQTHKILGVR